MTATKNERDRGKYDVFVMSTFLDKINRNEVSIEHKFRKSETQWNEEAKSNLIVSILNGYRFPSIVISEIIKNGFAYSYVIDGIQRVNACLEFKNNNLKIHDNAERGIVTYRKRIKSETGEIYFSLEEIDIHNKFYEDLPEELQNSFDGYNLGVDIYSPCTEEDIEYHIKRYNSIMY